MTNKPPDPHNRHARLHVSATRSAHGSSRAIGPRFRTVLRNRHSSARHRCGFPYPRELTRFGIRRSDRSVRYDTRKFLK